MKIAILYSGYIRTLMETISNHMDYFRSDLNEIDTYFSVWDKVGYANNINSPDFIFSKRILDPNSPITDSLIRSIVPSDVNVKRIKIEAYDPKNYSMKLLNETPSSLIGQFYKVADCCSLLDDSVSYDVVIRLRPDITLNKKIDMQLLADLVNEGRVIHATKIWYDYPKENHIKLVNDMVWITNQNLIEKTCGAYHNTDKINTIIRDRGQTEKNFGENLTYLNLEAHNLHRDIYTFDFDYNVVR